MTRINLTHPSTLTDQHLMAEFRELPRVYSSLEKALYNRKEPFNMNEIPRKFKLGTGHVKFFFDKLYFLHKRHEMIYAELLYRGFKVKRYNSLPYYAFGELFQNNWIPSTEDVRLSNQRLYERIMAKPSFYKHCGKPLSDDYLDNLRKSC